MVWTAGRCLRRTHVRLMHLSNQWCLRMLLGIRWYQFVRNDDVRRLTKQPKLTAIIQSRRLTLFGHIMPMDDKADAKRILLPPPLRQTGEDNWVVPASHGSAPSNRMWNISILRFPKQQIWLRTALYGGWVACQKRRRRRGYRPIKFHRNLSITCWDIPTKFKKYGVNPVPESGLWSGSGSKVNQFVHVPTSVDTQHFNQIHTRVFE